MSPVPSVLPLSTTITVEEGKGGNEDNTLPIDFASFNAGIIITEE
jgi:hypothetical protein